MTAQINRRGLDQLHAIPNPPIADFSQHSFKNGTFVHAEIEGRSVYQIKIKDQFSPFTATLEQGQIKWSSSQLIYPTDLEQIIEFTVANDRSLLINGGTHGNKRGETVCENPALGDTKILLEVAEKINRQQAFLRVAFHTVSQTCPPLTHEDYPNIDIIDGWCFSSGADVKSYALSARVKQYVEEKFREMKAPSGANVVINIYNINNPEPPPSPPMISHRALIEGALVSLYQQHRYTLMIRLFEEQVELSFKEGFFAIEIAKKTTRKIGGEESSFTHIDGAMPIATVQGPVETILETTFISIDHLMEPQGTPLRHLILEGRGGTGKSTLLSYLVYLFNFNKTALGSWASSFKYMLPISLLEMQTKGYDSIAKYLKKEEPSTFEQVTEEHIEQFIQENREQVLLLLDGYDEVAYTSFIQDFKKRYFNEKYHLIITSRPGYLTSTNSASCMKLELEGFSKISKEKYIRFFLARDNKEHIIASLLRQMDVNDTLASLGTIPLLLELITQYWEEEQEETIVTVSSLCIRLLEGLFNRWQEKKTDHPWRSISFEEIIKDPTLKEKLMFFSQAAWKASSLKRRDLKYRDYKRFSPPLDILESGFLRPISMRMKEPDCQFIHPLLQDFFSALHIALSLKDKTANETFTSLITKRLEPSIYWLAVGILNQLEEKDILDTLFKDLLTAQDAYTAVLSMRALEEVEECQNETALINRFISSVKAHGITDEEGALLADCHRIYMKREIRSFLLHISSNEDKFLSFALTGMEKALPQYAILAEQGNSEALFFIGSYYHRKGLFEESFRYYFEAARGIHAGAMNSLGVMYYKGRGVTQDNIEAVRWHIQAAEQGYAGAQVNLGWMYAHGEGVAQDKAEAFRWYTKAAEQGNARAQFDLGWMYAHGEEVPQDNAEAVRWYTKAAEQGDARAQCSLGFMYENDKGVAQDKEEALKWYTKAAEQGYANAQFNLGLMYAKGDGVAQDKEEAFKWYTKAAEQRYANAQFNLGVMYFNGEGVAQDKGEAFRWYTKAAEQGHASAQGNLGWMYVKGEGVPQDNVEAIRWYTKAAEQGHASAQFNLGLMYAKGDGVAQDKVEAARWYTKAAEQGYANAQFNLGVMYKNGEGIAQDKAEAVRWYTKAAEQGYANAQFNLGVMYKNGEGIAQDKAEAVKWYTKAAEQGYANAQFSLGLMYAKGEGVAQDNAKAISWYTKAAEQGHASAQGNLGEIFLARGDFNRAVSLFASAAEKKSVDGLFQLGCCYELGQGIESNMDKAMEFYQQAIEDGLLEKFRSKRLFYEDPSRLKILERLMNEHGFSL